MIIALLGVSVPSFVVASVLQYFLGLKLYMATGMRIFAITGWEGFNSHILPVVALGFGSLATISRLMRTSMLDVLGQDYIKTAKAKAFPRAASSLSMQCATPSCRSSRSRPDSRQASSPAASS